MIKMFCVYIQNIWILFMPLQSLVIFVYLFIFYLFFLGGGCYKTNDQGSICHYNDNKINRTEEEGYRLYRFRYKTCYLIRDRQSCFISVRRQWDITVFHNYPFVDSWSFENVNENDKEYKQPDDLTWGWVIYYAKGSSCHLALITATSVRFKSCFSLKLLLWTR